MLCADKLTLIVTSWLNEVQLWSKMMDYRVAAIAILSNGRNNYVHEYCLYLNWNIKKFLNFYSCSTKSITVNEDEAVGIVEGKSKVVSVLNYRSSEFLNFY